MRIEFEQERQLNFIFPDLGISNKASQINLTKFAKHAIGNLKLPELRHVLAATCVVFSLTGCGASEKDIQIATQTASVLLGGSGGQLTADEISRGLKQALSKSSEIVVNQVGQQNGYAADPQIRIPLPRDLIRAKSYADRVGLGSVFDDLELKLNRAAEQAAPKARRIFLGSIQQMTLEDANGILRGPDDAATKFFQRKTSTQLRNAMRPLIDDSLNQVGAVREFNNLLTAYRQIPLAPEVNADITEHVLAAGLTGIFYYVAQEEKAIRENPLKRTTELLQRVFGSQR